jgi:hypothetical protein
MVGRPRLNDERGIGRPTICLRQCSHCWLVNDGGSIILTYIMGTKL